VSALAEALIAAQAELPTALERDAANPDAGYRYMTLDALIAATRPILNKHGLAILQAPTTLDRRNDDGSISLVPALATRIVHSTSETMAYSYSGSPSTHIGEAIEYVMPLYLRDKDMQGLGAAITYARRYAWASALGIAAEEDTDAAPMPAADDQIPF
jgi:hypothetical protein